MSATTEAPAAYSNTAGARSPIALLTEAIGEVRSRQRLVGYLVRADMKKRGADTLIGNFWWVLDPLLQMAVYFVFITILARGLYPDFPLFIFCAILPWKWFSSVVNDASSSVVSSSQLIRQIAFPKIVLPISSATAGIVGFAFGLIPLGALLLFYSDRITPFVLLIPVIAVVQYVFSLAMAILVSAANVFFRDLGNVMRHLLRLWWYLSPGLYGLDRLSDVDFVKEHPIILTIFQLNPFSVLFSSYRAVIYGAPDAPGAGLGPDWVGLAILLVVSVVFLALATILFKRLEPTFAKVL